ncbi:MAG: Mov34/MPN/PAD-1 family protein [Thermoplasmatota archaeon]
MRSGDSPFIDSLCEPFGPGSESRGILGRILGNRNRGEVRPNDLLAAHEAMLVRGYYSSCITPLEELLRLGRIQEPLKETALSRAAAAALSHGLPLDIRPIVAEMGMSRRSASEALEAARKARRGRVDPLVVMEKAILRGLILNENASIVESESAAREILFSTRDSFREALSVSEEELKSSRTDESRRIWTYHRIRCLIEGGKWLLSVGEHSEGISLMREAYHNSDTLGFPYLSILSGGGLGKYIEDSAEGIEILTRCITTASDLGNEIEKGRLIFSKGNRTCIDGEGSGDKERIIQGAAMMIDAADVLGSSGDEIQAAGMRTQAGIWLIRGGDPKRSLEQLKIAQRSIDRGKDEELFITNRIALIYSNLKLRERRKSVKALLDLLYNNPVKQYSDCFNLLKEAVEGEKWMREDPRTKDLFAGEVVYTIDRIAVDEIIQRAKEAYPNEFGAMLRGIEHITHIEPVLEGAGGRTSFMFSLFSRFTQRTVPGEGVVHSHPSGSARPSRADLSMFGRFPGINIIIGHPYGEDSMAAYDRLGNRVKLRVVDRKRA